jgi:hypothetical protein
MVIFMNKQETYPISKYIGTYPNGYWVFVKEFEGTYAEAINEAKKLQETDVDKGKYSIWDDR